LLGYQIDLSAIGFEHTCGTSTDGGEPDVGRKTILQTTKNGGYSISANEDRNVEFCKLGKHLIEIGQIGQWQDFEGRETPRLPPLFFNHLTQAIGLMCGSGDQHTRAVKWTC